MDLRTLAHLPEWEWPADAEDILLAALLDEDAGDVDRRLAAELAGNVTVASESLVRGLLGIVRSRVESPGLRGTAAISLGPVLEELDAGVSDPLEPLPVSRATGREIQSVLRAVHLDPETPQDVRRRVLEASVRAEEGWHAGAVRAAYYSGDPDWGLTAVFCMQYVSGFEEEILEALSSQDPAVRFHAIQAAGAWGIRNAWPHIRTLLRGHGVDRPLLLAAIEATVGIDPEIEEASALLTPLLDVPDEDIAEAASDALITLEASWGL